MLERELGNNGSTKQFHQYLPEESCKRIIARTIQECELCREYPKQAYLTNLWKSSLSALQLSESHATPQQINHSVAPIFDTVPLPVQRTMSDWVDSLAGTGVVGQVNDELTKWVTAFLDEELAGSAMHQGGNSFYHTWKQQVQKDDSDPLFEVIGFTQKVSDLPTDPEDTIYSLLQHLGIPPEQWREYLACQFSLSPNWIRYIRWLGKHPDYSAQSKLSVDITQYLAVRMFYEVELTQMICQQTWGIEGTVPSLAAYWNIRLEEYDALEDEGLSLVDRSKVRICRDAWRFFHLAQFLELSPIDVLDLSFTDAQTVLQWLDDFPFDQHSLVWLEAYEESF